jgi:hypothetical protein
METRVRYGITLYKRKCGYCSLGVFWVPKASPQKFCSSECQTMESGMTPKYHGKRRRRKGQPAPQTEEVLLDGEFD